MTYSVKKSHFQRVTGQAASFGYPRFYMHNCGTANHGLTISQHPKLQAQRGLFWNILYKQSRPVRTDTRSII